MGEEGWYWQLRPTRIILKHESRWRSSKWSNKLEEAKLRIWDEEAGAEERPYLWTLDKPGRIEDET